MASSGTFWGVMRRMAKKGIKRVCHELREVEREDLAALLELYTHLHKNPLPQVDRSLTELWGAILDDPNHHIIACTTDGILVASCVLIVVPNLTQGQRHYGLIENVITHNEYRKKGYGTKVLSFAREIAVRHNCYKIMLLTGSKEVETLRFYERLGYSKDYKTGFVQWL